MRLLRSSVWVIGVIMACGNVVTHANAQSGDADSPTAGPGLGTPHPRDFDPARTPPPDDETESVAPATIQTVLEGDEVPGVGPPPAEPVDGEASPTYRWEVHRALDGTLLGRWVPISAETQTENDVPALRENAHPSSGPALPHRENGPDYRLHPYRPRYETGFRPEWGGFGVQSAAYDRLRNRVWGEFSVYRGTPPADEAGRVTVVTGVASAWLRPSPELRLDFHWPFGFGAVSQDAPAMPVETVFTGNPTASAAYVTATRRSEIRVAGVVAFPLASPTRISSDRSAGELLLDRAAAMDGATTAWMWRASSMSVLLSSSLDYDHGLIAGTQLTLGPMIDVDRGDVAFVFVTGGYVGARFLEIFRAGLRVSAAILAADRVQLSVAPFFELDSDLILSVRLLMNLNGPAGFAFSRGGVWALTVSGGGQF